MPHIYILLLELYKCLGSGELFKKKIVNLVHSQSKEGCTDQESIQSSTTPDPVYECLFVCLFVLILYVPSIIFQL